MLRVRHCIIILCLVSINLAAASPAGPYTSVRYKFSLIPPAGWIVKSQPDAVVSFIESEAADYPAGKTRYESNKEFIERLNRKLKAGSAPTLLKSSIIVTAKKVFPGTSVEQFARDTKERVAGLNMYKVTTEKPARLGGINAIARTARVTMPDGMLVSSREVMCVQNDSALTFSLTASPTVFNQRTLDFDKSLATLKWTK
jgi:hypothetical protein